MERSSQWQCKYGKGYRTVSEALEDKIQRLVPGLGGYNSRSQQWPYGLCGSCQLKLSNADKPNASGRRPLPPRFNWLQRRPSQPDDRGVCGPDCLVCECARKRSRFEKDNYMGQKRQREPSPPALPLADPETGDQAQDQASEVKGDLLREDGQSNIVVKDTPQAPSSCKIQKPIP